MTRRYDLDKLKDTLTSLKPLDPPAGLEEAIFHRIMLEPGMNETIPPMPVKRWGLSLAAVSAFGGLIIGAGMLLSQSNDSQRNASAPENVSAKPDHANQPDAKGAVAVTDTKKPENSPERKMQVAPPAQPAQPAQSTQSTQSTDFGLTNGVIVRIKNSSSQVSITNFEQRETKTADSFVNGDDLKQMLHAIFASGAEWVTINGRLVTEVDLSAWKSDFITVKGEPLTAPFEVKISGDPIQLQQTLQQDPAMKRLQQEQSLEVNVETIHPEKK